MSAAAEAAEARLFADTLVCTEALAYCLLPADPALAARSAAASERLLRALGQFEPPPLDDADPPAADPALSRIEAKLDLLLDLLSNRRERDSAAPRPLRWSRRGASVELDSAPVDGSLGVLRIDGAPGLPLPLELPVRVLASEPLGAGAARVWLAFEHELPALGAALERLLFRQHRRQIAAQRRG